MAQMKGLNGGSGDVIPVMVELFKDAKAIFKGQSSGNFFTKGTGGSEFGFHSQPDARRCDLKDWRGTAQRVPDQLHTE